jgi:signal transduction histidine kinase
MGIDDLRPRVEVSRLAAERAHQRVQAALNELEAARVDAATAQLAAEDARDAAESAQVWAEAATREAELAQRRLQNFLAMAAHDIRGPLSAIAGYTDLLAARDTAPSERDVAADAVQTAVRQMDRLVEDIVAAGRLGAGTFRLRYAPLDLVPLIRQVVRGQQAASNRHRLLVEAPERLDGEWDPDRLGQVLTNLVSNAIKYSPAGGDVTITARREEDTAVVVVADRGGIHPADLPLLFRPFTRLISPDEQARVPGTGLGLYISQGIVQAHGGLILATSEGESTGSEFTVRLPLRRRSPVADAGPE